jgi:hypothetical protein
MDATVAGLIDELVETLSAPVDDPEWSDETRLAWRQHLLGIRKRLERGEQPNGDEYHMMRWLSFYGIGAGPVAVRFRALYERLHELYAEGEWPFAAHAVATS